MRSHLCSGSPISSWLLFQIAAAKNLGLQNAHNKVIKSGHSSIQSGASQENIKIVKNIILELCTLHELVWSKGLVTEPTISTQANYSQ